MKVFLQYLGAGLVILFSSTVAIAATCSSIKYSAPSGSSNDIEFVFDDAYKCGQFANGDWWVSPSPKASMKIVSISPAIDVVNGNNGFEVNPLSFTKQGFDSRISGYDQTLQPSLPLTLPAVGNFSIVKAVSFPSADTDCRPCLQYAAVLTVTAKPVLKSTVLFRPGYFGSSKSFIATEKITRRALKRIPITCCTEAKNVSFESIAARYKNVQLDHLENFVVRFLHPADNMPDYGADIARDNAVYLLRMLMSDFSFAKPVHKAALINYLQMAIDLRSMAENGATWPANGGHGNGRKLPILFAGWLFGDNGFRLSVLLSSFSEDTQIYYSKRAGRALYGRECTDAAYWKTTLYSSGAADCRDPYGLIDGGGYEIGASYQECCTAKPWKYTALAIRLLGIQKLWKNDNFLEYVYRWVDHGAWAIPDSCAPYDGIPDNYGKTFGPMNGSIDCIAGVGRFTDKDGLNVDGGGYSDILGEQMWDWAHAHQ